MVTSLPTTEQALGDGSMTLGLLPLGTTRPLQPDQPLLRQAPSPQSTPGHVHCSGLPWREEPTSASPGADLAASVRDQAVVLALTSSIVAVSSHFVTYATSDRPGGIGSKGRQGRLLESPAPSPSSPRRITMSKTSNKIRRFALFGLAAAMATGVTTVAPPARADEVTATVFSA